jgi:hypothetical protein
LGFRISSMTLPLIKGSGEDRSGKWTQVFGYFCLVLLFLLLPNSFAQAHLWKHRPFRAADTDHSGGDHLCYLRRDRDGDGRPERLGDYILATGTVIAEPSTYETGGWIFWMRDRTCGIMVYGEQETLSIGDSVDVRGWLRITNGEYFFPETGLATLGDIAIENGGVVVTGRSHNHQPVDIRPVDYCDDPQAYGGNLIRITGLVPARRAFYDGGDVWLWLSAGTDSLIAYIDRDIGHPALPEPTACIGITGIVTRMRPPSGFAVSPAWCIAPRSPGDLVSYTCPSVTTPLCWGKLKAGFAGQD